MRAGCVCAHAFVSLSTYAIMYASRRLCVRLCARNVESVYMCSLREAGRQAHTHVPKAHFTRAPYWERTHAGVRLGAHMRAHMYPVVCVRTFVLAQSRVHVFEHREAGRQEDTRAQFRRTRDDVPARVRACTAYTHAGLCLEGVVNRAAEIASALQEMNTWAQTWLEDVKKRDAGATGSMWGTTHWQTCCHHICAPSMSSRSRG